MPVPHDPQVKEFDRWNVEKKRIHDRVSAPFAYPREIWWCSFGANVGAEIDGKNENFERPALIVRVYNKETMLVLPITSREKEDKFHIAIEVPVGTVWVVLTQVRVVSSKRLLRKLGVLSSEVFSNVIERFREYA